MMRRMTKLIDNKLLDLRTPTLAPVNFTVTPELLAQSDIVDLIKDHMKEIVKAMKKQAKGTEDNISQHAQLSDVFELFSKACQDNHTMPQAASVLRDAAAFVQKLNELTAKNEEKVQQVLSTTMETFVTDGLKPAVEKKRQYDREAMDYDNMITKHKNAKRGGKMTPQKEREAEQQISDAKEEYMTTEKETLELLKQAGAKGEILTIVKVVEYWDSINTYFKEGVAFLQTMQPKIERYRKHIRDLAKAPVSAQTKVFKQPLEKLCAREQRRVPQIVVACCLYLSQKGLDTQGLFRVSPTKDSMDDLKRDIDMGRSYDFSDQSNPHTISGVLKAFFRELPDPIFTFERYSQFMEASKLPTVEEQLKAIEKLVKALPPANYKTLQHVTRLCCQIDARNAENKMTVSNLAVVLTPNLLYTNNMDPMTMVQDMEQANKLYELIVNNYATIFPADDLDLDVVLIEIKSPRSAAIAESSGSSSPLKNSASSDDIEAAPGSAPASSLRAPQHPSRLNQSAGTPGRPTTVTDKHVLITSSAPTSPASSYSSHGLATGDDEIPVSSDDTTTKKRRKMSRNDSLKEATNSRELTESASSGALPSQVSPRTKLHRETSLKLDPALSKELAERFDEEGRKKPKSARSKKSKGEAPLSPTSESSSSRDRAPSVGGGTAELAVAKEASDSRQSSRRSTQLTELPVPPASDEEPKQPTPPVVTELKKFKKRKTIAISVDAKTYDGSSAEADTLSAPSTPKSPKASTSPSHETSEAKEDETRATETASPATSPTKLNPLTDAAPVSSYPGASATPISDQEASSQNVSPSKIVKSPSNSDSQAPSAGVPSSAGQSSEVNPKEAVSEPHTPELKINDVPEKETPPPYSSTPKIVEPEPVSPGGGIDNILESLVHSSHEDQQGEDEEIPGDLPEPPSELTVLLDPSILSTVDAFASFAKIGCKADLDDDGVATLSQATRELAMQTKSLSSGSDAFVSNYPETEQQISDSLTDLQTWLRTMILAVKEVTNSPTAESALTNLQGAIASYSKRLANFNSHLTSGSLEQLVAAALPHLQKTSTQIAPIVRGLLGQSLDAPYEDTKNSVERDIHHVLTIAAMINAQITSPAVTVPLDQAVDALEAANKVFWAKASELSSPDADAHDIGQSLVQHAKALISALRSTEAALQQCAPSAEVLHPPVALHVARAALVAAIDEVAHTVLHGSASDLPTRLLLSGAKRTIRRFVEQTKALAIADPATTEPEALLSVLSKYTEAVTKLITYVKYHKIDSDQPLPMTSAHAVGALLTLSRARPEGILVAVEKGTDEAALVHLLLLVLRITRSTSKAIFG